MRKLEHTERYFVQKRGHVQIQWESSHLQVKEMRAQKQPKLLTPSCELPKMWQNNLCCLNQSVALITGVLANSDTCIFSSKKTENSWKLCTFNSKNLHPWEALTKMLTRGSYWINSYTLLIINSYILWGIINQIKFKR